MEIPVIRNILEANERISEELKKGFDVRHILCLNIMSSPGAGKTSLLERTLRDLRGEFKMAVIEGDLRTDNDARRVAATGAQAVQVNTEGGCHLDSSMVLEAVNKLDLEGVDILFVENVGNLVCPAEFSVGEDHKITLLSVAEGDDKPEKYPLMFHLSSVLILNKIDLLPYVDFDLGVAEGHARKLNKKINVFPLSCKTGEGLGAWYEWLRAARAVKK
ncbi:MAG: hydrogenase nickel incorporation protein HypB [Desulfovibrionaceae bacterium]|nr:hydrogenase nickel incorporation protein HypB [Desulfovibrionaceae bacterium]